MKKNVASQLVSAQMITIADGSDMTTGTCNVAVEIDGVAGTGGTATHIANGKWEYAPIQADTNGDYLTFQFVITNAVTVTVQIYTGFPQTVDNDTKLTTIAADVVNVDGYNLATQIGTAGAGLTNVGGSGNDWNTVVPDAAGVAPTAAEIKAEMVDVLFTDTDAEPPQGTPGATISLADKIGYLYKAWRNRSNQTSTTYQLFNDDATTVDHKATVSDDTVTTEKSEVTTGP